jgi:drug/metabolite transporter (DMT)-like permease
LLFCIQIIEKFMHMLGTHRRFPSSLVVSHASFLIVGGYFIVGGCTELEDCAPTVFSVVLLWLGGLFFGGFSVVVSRFFDVLWWLGGFFCGALVFFLLLMALALSPLVFSAFLEVIRD